MSYEDKKQIIIHDIKSELKDLKIKLEQIRIARDLNEFMSKISNFLTAFKKIIDNHEKTLACLFQADLQKIENEKSIFNNLRQDVYIKYVIYLRNFEQHHNNEFKEKIGQNSIIGVGGNGFQEHLHLSNGRILEEKGTGSGIKITFIVKKAFGFIYEYGKRKMEIDPIIDVDFNGVLLKASEKLEQHLMTLIK